MAKQHQEMVEETPTYLQFNILFLIVVKNNTSYSIHLYPKEQKVVKISKSQLKALNDNASY